MRQHISANGTSQFAWYCMDCKRWALRPPQWIKHDVLKRQLAKQDAVLEDIPITEDYRNALPCVVCGEPGEMHHWAPQAYSESFGEDWYLWPLEALCIRHHRRWHQIVTPDLVK